MFTVVKPAVDELLHLRASWSARESFAELFVRYLRTERDFVGEDGVGVGKDPAVEESNRGATLLDLGLDILGPSLLGNFPQATTTEHLGKIKASSTCKRACMQRAAGRLATQAPTRWASCLESYILVALVSRSKAVIAGLVALPIARPSILS